MRVGLIASGLILVVLFGCGGGDAAARVEEARTKLRAGEAEAARALLDQLAESRGDQDPELAFNRGVAAAAAEQLDAANRAFGVVLERGTKPLRARALVALATLDLAFLERDAEIAATLTKAEARTRIRERAEAALARLSAAQALDPESSSALERQDRLIAWLRETEDAWARADAEAASAKRRANKGASFFRAIADEVLAVAEETVGAALWSTLSLRVRAVAGDLEVASEKLQDLKELSEADQSEVSAGVDRLSLRLEQLEGQLRDAEWAAVPDGLVRAQQAALRLVVATGDLTPAVQALAEMVGGLGAAATRETAPVLLSELSDLLREVVACTANVEALEAKPATKAAVPAPALKFAAATRVRTQGHLNTAMESASAANAEPAQKELEFARAALTELQRELEWAASPCASIATRLRDEARRNADEISGEPSTLDARERSTWAEHQSRRLTYLRPALEREHAKEGEEGAESDARTEAIVKALDAFIERAKTAHGEVQSAIAPPSSLEPLLVALDQESEALRVLAWHLLELPVVAEEAAVEAAAAVATNHDARRLARDVKDELPAALLRGRQSPARQSSRAGVLADATDLLLARAEAELGAQKGEPGAPPAPAPPSNEGLLRDVQNLWRDGQSALRAAALDLRSDGLSSPAAVEESLRRALGDQSLASKAYDEAARKLRENQIPLLQIATQMMAADGKALPPLRALGAARSLPGITLKSLLRELSRTTRPLLRGLDGALAREFARKEQAAAAEEPPADPKEAERERIIAKFVEELRAADSGVATARLTTEATTTCDAVDVRYAAARKLWRALVDRQAMLKQAIEEEGRLEQELAGAATNPAQVQTDVQAGMGVDQARTLELLPELLRLYTQAESGGAPTGEPPKEDPLKKKAEDLIPRAEAAMEAVLARIKEREFRAAEGRAGEAKSLLLELEKEEQNEDQKQQNQPPPPPEPSEAKPDPADAERQRRSVLERSKKLQDKLQKQRPPTPVAEDW